jgi:folate-binding protein YgfZ
MKQRVLLKGKDGLDLLHRISTIDLKQPKSREKTQGLILNPQGKIRASFAITLLSNDTAEIEFEDAFLEALDQYTFSERYEIEKLTDAAPDSVSEQQRILSLTPKLGAEFKSDEATNPLEVNLKSAIHDQKGCYPGQEVVEKIISLGSPSRKLCLLEGVLDSITCPRVIT